MEIKRKEGERKYKAKSGRSLGAQIQIPCTSGTAQRRLNLRNHAVQVTVTKPQVYNVT
jgi:hypothetical protein